MKAIPFLILSFLFLLFACGSDDNGGNQDPITQLPPATQTGENTAGCLVNGEILLPRGSGLGGPVLSAFYQLIDGEYFFGLGISNSNGSKFKTLNVVFLRTSLQEGQTYMLNKNMMDDGDYTGGGGIFFFN